LFKKKNSAQLEIPDDSAIGGVLIFKFLKKTFVKDIQILAIDVNETRINTSFANPGIGWRKRRFKVKNLRDNSLQTVRMEQDKQRQVVESQSQEEWCRSIDSILSLNSRSTIDICSHYIV
jgi:hypothetical protein